MRGRKGASCPFGRGAPFFSIHGHTLRSQMDGLSKPMSVQGSEAGCRLLHPELVHVDEGLRVLRLEQVPLIEVGHDLVAGEPPAVILRGLAAESDEGKIVFAEERLDLRNRQSMLLHMEKQV